MKSHPGAVISQEIPRESFQHRSTNRRRETMGRRVRIMSALVAGTLAFVVGTSTAHAILKSDQYKCQTAIAKEGASYLTKKLKLIQKCKDADLATPGSCAAPDPAAIQKLEDKLAAGLAKKCAFDKLGP